MYCSLCGTKIEDNSNICPNCGSINQSYESLKKQETKEKNPIKVSIIISSVICGIVLLSLIVSFSIKFFKPKTAKTENNKKIVDNTTTKSDYIVKPINVKKLKVVKSSDESNNVEVVKMLHTKDEYSSKLFVLLKNNNSFPIYINCFFNYLDSDGMRVDRKINSGYILPSTNYVAVFENMTKEEYKSTNIEIKAEKVKSYLHVVDIDKNNLEVFKTDMSDIVARYNSTSDTELDLYYGIIYYKDDKIAFFDFSFASDVSKENKKDANFYISRFPNYDYNKDVSEYYDKYEVFVSGAVYKDSTY